MSENIQYLYRYRHLNGRHREWTKKILTESVIHFSDPSTFNDPFDCKVHYIPSFSSDVLKRQYEERIKRHMPALNRKQRKVKAIQDIKNVKPQKLLSQVTNSIQKSINGVGVLSLSATDRNILLWSHYADGHKGLCLKFVVSDDTTPFWSAMQVKYISFYPKISITSPVEEQVDGFLLTKAIDWRYEEEYRIIDHKQGAGDKTFPPKLLIGVIFGARMVADDKKEVAEWVSGRKDHIELFEATVAKGSFSLEIRPYEG